MSAWLSDRARCCCRPPGQAGHGGAATPAACGTPTCGVASGMNSVSLPPAPWLEASSTATACWLMPVRYRKSESCAQELTRRQPAGARGRAAPGGAWPGAARQDGHMRAPAGSG